MYSLTRSDATAVAQPSSAIEPHSAVDLQLREKFGSDLLIANSNLSRRESRERSWEMVPFMGVVLSPFVSLIPWASLLMSVPGGMFAGLGTMVVLGGLVMPPVFRRGKRTEKLRGAWKQWAIADLRNRTGIALNVEELDKLNYLQASPNQDKIIGSIDKFFPGEGIARVTLVSESGKLNLLRGEILTPVASMPSAGQN